MCILSELKYRSISQIILSASSLNELKPFIFVIQYFLPSEFYNKQWRRSARVKVKIPLDFLKSIEFQI